MMTRMVRVIPAGPMGGDAGAPDDGAGANGEGVLCADTCPGFPYISMMSAMMVALTPFSMTVRLEQTAQTAGLGL